MLLSITALYAGLLALLLLVLSIYVIVRRGTARVSLGDGGDSDLNHRIRAQANFAEYAPIGLIVMGLTEAMAAPAIAVHGLGLALVLGRTFHALGLLGPKPLRWMRAVGTLLTFGVLLLGGAGLTLHQIL